MCGQGFCVECLQGYVNSKREKEQLPCPVAGCGVSLGQKACFAEGEGQSGKWADYNSCERREEEAGEGAHACAHCDVMMRKQEGCAQATCPFCKRQFCW